MRILSSAVVVCCLVSGVGRTELYAQPAVGPTAASPTTVTQGVATDVTVTSEIADPSVTSVILQRYTSAGAFVATVGTLRDDGTAGDATAGDRIYTVRVSFLENATGGFQLRVSAAFRGVIRRSLSNLMTIQVVAPAPPPTIAAAVAPAPNGAGWNLSDATVQFSCTNATSCPANVVVSTETAGQVVQGTATGPGGSATASVTVKLDKTPPAVAISSPSDGATVSTASVTVTGTVSDALSGLNAVTCNGASATFDATSFTCSIALQDGANPIAVQATDVAGHSAGANISVRKQTTQVTAPVVTITQPAASALFGASPTTVTGTVDDPNATVAVNGVAATVQGGGYQAIDVPLREGHNILTATATNAAGGVGSASVTVHLDTTPPTVLINAPTAGAILTTTQVSVTGMINDIVSGTVNADQASVTVNGLAAAVSNRSFLLPELLLVRGRNVITAVAEDRAGNRNQTQIEVTVQDPIGQQRIAMVSGNNQSGAISSVLQEPLAVQLLSADGQPLAERAVTFTVRRSDGLVRAFPEEGQQVTVRSDSNGQASVLFQLGTRTGVGTNEVAVTSPGFAGEVIFCASSTVSPAAQINVVSGENQRGLVGAPLPMPFVTIVFDGGGNPVANEPVTFKVTQGGGSFDGNATKIVNTDSDGRATALLTVGLQEGLNNHVATASLASGAAATFTASGIVAGNAADTRVSGVVLDNADVPIPNATAKIVGTNLTAITDAQGSFSISGAPVGTLTLIVDGSTSTRPEKFPFLAFMLISLSGQDNTIGMPIYIPPLDTSSAKMVGGAQEVVLTMAGVPGVAFTVAPHSAVFPDGSRTGLLGLSQVHADKVPMPPPNGTAPRVVWTLQPANVHFDPPIKVQLPNTDGLPPGQVIEVFQFDHDLEQFVSVGAARVSTDGSVIVSDPGFGITKSGWGGAPPPPPPPKKPCVGSCDDKNPCTTDTCNDGTCEHPPIADGTACQDADDRSFVTNGVTVNIAKSCSVGTCQTGTCKPKSDRWGLDNVEAAMKDALGKIFQASSGDCMGEPIRTAMQNKLKDSTFLGFRTGGGFKINCIDSNSSAGDGTDDCASAALGDNKADLSNLSSATCGSLAKSLRHEMQHAAGNRDHVNQADGSLDCANDTVYACDQACYGANNCGTVNTANCK